MTRPTDQLTHVLCLLQQQLGDSLLALHLYGSAVDGGLQTWSDLDLLGTLSEPVSDELRASLMTMLLEVSAWPPTSSLRPLEVTLICQSDVRPWRYPPWREFQFGEWLREEIRKGRYEAARTDHDLAILLSKVRRNSLCLFGPPASELFAPVPTEDFRRALFDTLTLWNEESDWIGEERNVVLTLARIWYSVSTGEIASKDAAASWALERLSGSSHSVLSSAQNSYLGLREDDLSTRTSEVATYIASLKKTLHQLEFPGSNES